MDDVSSDILDALGGTTAVARMVHAPVSTVHSWRRNGIPASRAAHLLLAAQAAQIVVPPALRAMVEVSHTGPDIAGRPAPSPCKVQEITPAGAVA